MIKWPSSKLPFQQILQTLKYTRSLYSQERFASNTPFLKLRQANVLSHLERQTFGTAYVDNT